MNPKLLKIGFVCRLKSRQESQNKAFHRLPSSVLLSIGKLFLDSQHLCTIVLKQSRISQPARYLWKPLLAKKPFSLSLTCPSFLPG
ncbi:hypothetical protein BB560_002456 [Smittium megazygosporum]|uniref:Uncharacterized protein n=1 Tax=Smittium megazygosporum TaxID=133381 RepID=A0A2T9ZES5_9FUNG|nr:hypothetical protein BB560_002456 [Smittium megazygosporum]